MAIIGTNEVITPKYFLYEDANGVNYLFFDYLQKTFGEDRPILIEDIKLSECSQEQILKAFTNLCICGKLIKFDEETYYIPTETPLGMSDLSTKLVIEKKYIRNNTKVYGFYGGIGIQNYLGLSTQVVATPTIYTNKETTNERKVQVGWCDVILKKPITKITAENVYTLTLLKVIDDAPKWWFETKDTEKLQCLTSYIKEKQITKQNVDQYLPLFPSDTSKKITESGLIFYATR